MSYDYVRQAYGLNPVVGRRVRHNEIDKWGTICRENKGQSHYVMVKFDGRRHSVPCHPKALDYYSAPNAPSQTSQQDSSAPEDEG